MDIHHIDTGIEEYIAHWGEWEYGGGADVENPPNEKKEPSSVLEAKNYEPKSTAGGPVIHGVVTDNGKEPIATTVEVRDEGFENSLNKRGPAMQEF